MTNEHWRYFLTLEEDIERTTRFVEPNPANYATYSLEFVRLILSICSEVEVVCKVLCERIKPARKVKNMNNYREVITRKYPKLHTSEISVDRFGLTFKPWEEWGTPINPAWWQEHQDVKHRRHKHFALANLRRCLEAAAGLFCLVLYLYVEDLRSLQPRPRLFTTKVMTGSYFTLPDFV